MDKKNVQIWNIKNTLTEEKICLDRKKVWCRVKRQRVKIVSLIFLYFSKKSI
jgi:hypothetical protein